MAKLFLFILIITTVSVSGQEKKFSLGMQGSMDYYIFDFIPDKKFSHSYETSSAFSTGLRIQYYINDKLSLKSGALYSKKGIAVKYRFIFIEPGDPLIPKESLLKVNYLGIPLVAGYNFIDKEKFKLPISLGILNEFLINNSEKTIYENNSEHDSKFYDQNLNNYLLSFQLNPGIEYYPIEKLFFVMEPYVRYSVTKIDNYIINKNTHSYGLILSVNYRL